jgi:hypothetical protein
MKARQLQFQMTLAKAAPAFGKAIDAPAGVPWTLCGNRAKARWHHRRHAKLGENLIQDFPIKANEDKFG